MSSEKELVSTVDIAERLGVTPERVRQLAKNGRLPSPAGRSGRATLWFWEAIQGWAVANGRIDGSGRPPSQVWLEFRRKELLFDRTQDTVIRWGTESLAHVRIWEPTGADGRPVVLLGTPEDNPGRSVTNGIEVVAMEVVDSFLGPLGLQADWYEYWPTGGGGDHSFSAVTFEVDSVSVGRRITGSGPARLRLRSRLTDPQWTEIEREALELLLREEVEVYPLGAYNSDAILRHRPTGTPLLWDPTGLRADVATSRALLAAVHEGFDARIAHAATRFMIADGQERAAENQTSARNQPRGVGISLAPYAPTKADRAVLNESGGEDAFPVGFDDREHRMLLQQELRRWLLKTGTPEERLMLVPGSRGLAWLDAWDAGLDGDLDAERIQQPSIRRADKRLEDQLWDRDRALVEADFPLLVPSSPMDIKSLVASSYLETVSWWGPSDEDHLRAKRLEARLERESSVRFGYDPWGRLVARGGKAFAVEYPIGATAESPDDSAVVKATSSGGFNSGAFIELGDGRLDLLPLSDRKGGFGFSWGYGGSGPHAFTSALVLLAMGQKVSTKSAQWRAIHELVVQWKGKDFSVLLGDLRSAEKQLAGSFRQHR